MTRYYSSLSVWMFVGVLLFMLGFFAAPSANAHKSIFYWLILLPGLLALPRWFDTHLYDFQAVLPVVSVLFYLSLTALWSPDFSFEFLMGHWKKTLYIAFFLLAVIAVFESILRFQLVVLPLFLLAALICGLLLCYQFYQENGWDFYKTLIVDWRYGNQNRMAKVYGFSFVVAVSVVLQCRYLWLRCLAVGVAIISILVVFLSRSQGAMYALLLTLPFLLLLNRNNIELIKQKAFYLIVVVIVAGLVLWWMGVIGQYIEQGWSNRDSVWLGVLQNELGSIWFGTGLLANEEVTGLDGVSYGHEHNVFLALLRQSGLVGVILFCWALITLMKKAFLSSDSEERIWGVLLVYGVLASLSGGKFPLQRPTEAWILLWVPIAFLMAKNCLAHSRSDYDVEC